MKKKGQVLQPINQRPPRKYPKRLWVLAIGVLWELWAGGFAPVQAQMQAQMQAQTVTFTLDRDCRLMAADAQHKTALRSSKVAKDRQQYQALIQRQGQALQRCRSQTWPQQQAIWLRLYPCDTQPQRLEAVLDRIVDQGYNQVFVEVFYDGRVLLPRASNITAWPAVINEPGYENTDLLKQAIALGHHRGLSVSAWLFTLNFGYSYSNRDDRQSALARNGANLTSLDLIQGETQVFIDPYNPQARLDYAQLVKLVLDRHPDGILFDYVRYPRGTGTASAVGQVKDLMIYSPAAQQALLDRALNNKGRDLIQLFLQKGFISAGDLQQVNKRYPQEGEPLWQGRVPQNPPADGKPIPLDQQQARIQQELWLLSIAHAQRGVLDFLQMGVTLAKQSHVPAGAVFFPGGNQRVGQWGYDSRLQPWDQFPADITWNPMAYATCSQVTCILSDVERVVSQAPAGVQIQPALAGLWGQATIDRPSLEDQMAALHQTFPQMNAVSHFAYSWQYPQDDQERKFCHLP